MVRGDIKPMEEPGLKGVSVSRPVLLLTEVAAWLVEIARLARELLLELLCQLPSLFLTTSVAKETKLNRTLKIKV
jgi:hypothetical protein